MPTRDQPVPRPSQIVESMTPGYRYRADQIAAKFHAKCPEVHLLLRKMVDDGVIQSARGARDSRYFIPATELPRDESIAPGSYMPEFREMKPYDNASFKRLCEGARNPKTGVV